MRTLSRRPLLAATLVLASLGLAGCAGLNTVSGEVSSFGQWPEGRAPGSYAFERLPSQQQDGEHTRFEALAAQALQARGFTPVAAGAKPDVVVQIGARVTRQSRSPWDDPFWWRFGSGYGSRWYGVGAWRWSSALDPEYDREAALLLRDAASGTPLYEARAHSTGVTPGGDRLLGGLFLLSLSDFPAARPEPHAASVVLP